MLNTVEVAPRHTSWRHLTRQAVGPAGRRLEPYLFLSPTLVILLILMSGSMILAGLGVIGLYLAKIYDEVRGRPRSVVSQTTFETAAVEEPAPLLRS